MYECPNCAANLKYSISKQMLFCESCDTAVDPYSFHKEQDAEEYTEYEVTVFTCPQCGGRILSEDTTAATFCSFCDSSTILDSRISKEKRPAYIIPFSKTEANCRTAYKKMLRHAIYAPKELKDENHIKKFRGIYMPYWVYSFEKKGPVTFKGSRSHQKGDYLITKYYDVNCDVDAEYKGVAFDASSTFSDNLSNAIAPFDIKKSKPFTPAFLSGFYADTNDVANYLYKHEAEDIILDIQCQQLQKKSAFSKYNISSSSSMKRSLRPDRNTAELALFPVWFLSYRKDDRVAYAIVNGQTGKAAGDLPVDSKKYLIGSLLLAIPIFILLNLFFTLKPNWLLILVAFLALICATISNKQITRIIQRENGEDDKGLQNRKSREPGSTMRLLSEMRGDTTKDFRSSSLWKNIPEDSFLVRFQEKLNRISSKKKENGDSTINNTIKHLVIWFIAIVFAPFILMGLLTFMPSSTSVESFFNLFMVLIIALVFAPFIGIFVTIKKKRERYNNGTSKIDWKLKLPFLLKPIIGIVVAILILIINPVSDIIYYLGAIFCMCMSAWMFVDIINRYNILSTRKLPQLNKRGGDEVE